MLRRTVTASHAYLDVCAMRQQLTNRAVALQDSADAMADIPVDTRSTLSRQAKKGSAGKRVSIKDFPKEWLPTPPTGLPSAGVGKQGGAEKVKP